MKRFLSTIIWAILTLSLVGCGSGENIENGTESKPDVTIEDQNKEDKEQENLNEELKQEAVKADFVELNSNTEENKSLKVFAEGEISVVDYDNVMDIFPSFLLTQEEGKGYGVYHITNIFGIEGLEDGDNVKVYGVVDGKNDSGIVKITATVIEKN